MIGRYLGLLGINWFLNDWLAERLSHSVWLCLWIRLYNHRACCDDKAMWQCITDQVIVSATDVKKREFFRSLAWGAWDFVERLAANPLNPVWSWWVSLYYSLEWLGRRWVTPNTDSSDVETIQMQTRHVATWSSVTMLENFLTTKKIRTINANHPYHDDDNILKLFHHIHQRSVVLALLPCDFDVLTNWRLSNLKYWFWILVIISACVSAA